ncbi:MAG: hypothetical protein LC737_05560, partial [Chloroflexi bacterium]|nr:hypothetical protein [Chloroflexota bacterium]
IGTFIAADLHWLARPLVRVARWRQRNQPITHNKGEEQAGRPRGPFRTDRKHECAVLLFVPRSLKSHFIDDLTGAYGYSHVAIDVGEVDVLTNRRVMTEATLGDTVHRSFQDTYGERPYLRVPFGPLAEDCAELRDCVNSKLGQPFSDKEALTWGAVDDPAKQICSDLAANCLPEKSREDIVHTRHRGKVRPYAVSVHRLGHRKPYVFVSPNGFAQYFGAPRGHEIKMPDTLFQSSRTAAPSDATVRAPLKAWERAFAVVMTLVCSLLIGVLVRRQRDLR